MLDGVISALECILNMIEHSDCEQCKYECLKTMYISAPVNLLIDALVMLKEIEPRVMTLEEVKYSEMPVWLEWNYYFLKPALMHTDQVMTEDCRGAITFVLFGDEEWYTYADDDYGKEIRCWTSRPTDAQREAVPWN